MNIFLYELKSYRKSTFIWMVSLVAITAIFMSMFPSISNDIDQFKKLIEGYPEAVRKAVGLQIESMGSLLGFYSYSFLYISLCGAIQGMNLGTSIISKEIREKTADFLLTKPVKRSTIITSKLLAAFVSLLMTNIVFVIGAFMIASLVKTSDYDEKTFMLISLTLFFIQLIFLSIGFLLAVIIPKIRSVIAVSLGTVFMFFVIGMLSSTSGDEISRYISPFKYFDNAYIMTNRSYESPYMIVGAVIIVLSIVTSYIVYIKKDVHSI